jgi:predicted transcriptional regulator
VRTIMTRDVAHCRPSDPLTDVWSIMKERGFQRVPIVSGMGTPIGVVYTRDVLQGLLREAEVEDKLLLEYISGVGYR